MSVLLLEFTDKIDVDDCRDEKPENSRLRVPRQYYLDLMEQAQQVRMDWVFRQGVDFICDSCKSFGIPAKSLYQALRRIYVDPYEVYCGDHVGRHLTRPFPMNADLWLEYFNGKLKHIPFIFERTNEFMWWREEGPEILAYDDVIFKFRMNCSCDAVFKSMCERKV